MLKIMILVSFDSLAMLLHFSKVKKLTTSTRNLSKSLIKSNY